MFQGWEVDEDNYMDHLITVNQLQQAVGESSKEDHSPSMATQTILDPQVISRIPLHRQRTSSMPKMIFEKQKLEAIVQSPKKSVKYVPDDVSPLQRHFYPNLKSPIKGPLRMNQSLSKKSIKTTLFHNPLEDSKFSRTSQLRQFTSTFKTCDPNFPGMKGFTRSVKSASMSNIFNDERINYRKKVEDFVFKLRPQRGGAIINMNQTPDEMFFRPKWTKN